jgi:hypothetical protein
MWHTPFRLRQPMEGCVCGRWPGYQTWRPCRSQPAAGLIDPFTRKWPNTIAICSLMKDEHIDDVKEFISYHRCVFVHSSPRHLERRSESSQGPTVPFPALLRA